MSIFSRCSWGSKFTRTVTRGFTLIELLVVLSIVFLISTIVLFSVGRFNSSILLRSLAYQIGLSLREAQLYGVAVKESSAGSGNFGSAYGIYISQGILNKPNTTYPLFADLNNNGLYDDGINAVVENFTLQNNLSISNACALTGTAAYCENLPCPTLPSGIACSPAPINQMVISFKRPDPNAVIMTSPYSGPYSNALITVASQNGSTRTVAVSATGQIVVQDVQGQ